MAVPIFMVSVMAAAAEKMVRASGPGAPVVSQTAGIPAFSSSLMPSTMARASPGTLTMPTFFSVITVSWICRVAGTY